MSEISVSTDVETDGPIPGPLFCNLLAENLNVR
jgi:hypothetical protein